MVEQKRYNRLAKANSAYLRSAKHQPVDWYPWGEEAFAEAARQNKPVLLDVGAVWCHWCHVMDRESYDNPGLAAQINRDFIAIKVDRDERPDVDTRFQAAVAAISGQSGWPLTVFLTQQGEPFFGGTYFPLDSRYGRPGFPQVLARMAEAYRTQRSEAVETAGSVLEAIEHNESFSGPAGVLSEELLVKITASMTTQFDRRNGGFGSEPKFPHAAALSLLMDVSARTGTEADLAHEIVTATLARMANGGIHDHLAGGFHRYSVDERWVVPHFEKLASDNSELLRAYMQVFQSFVEPRFARVAAAIVGWMSTSLSDQAGGGFYAAQDADASLDEDGDFFTWTREQAEAVLTAEEFAVAAAFYNLRAVGDMHHQPEKNVLHTPWSLTSVAARLGIAEETAAAQLEGARRNLLQARLRRTIPYIDHTLYTGPNALCISAYLAAGRVLAMPEAVQFALRTLDRVLDGARLEEHRLAHVVAYGELGADQRSTDRVPAVLEDYGYLANSCLDAWEATGELRYFQSAEQFANVLLERFYDPLDGGFFDIEKTTDAPRPGALTTRRKPVQDAPTPSGNAAAATLLLRLHALTERALFRHCAEATLQRFAGIVEHYGLYAAGYALALRRFLSPPIQICVIGEDELADALAAMAMARFLVNKSVVRLRFHQLDQLPPALAGSLPQLPGVREGSLAVLCRGFACLPPVRDPDELFDLLSESV